MLFLDLSLLSTLSTDISVRTAAFLTGNYHFLRFKSALNLIYFVVNLAQKELDYPPQKLDSLTVVKSARDHTVAIYWFNSSYG